MLKRLLDAVSQTARPKVRELPIFPLANVLFPGGVIPLRIFEPRYMGMAKACLKNDVAFGVCLIREGEEVGEPAIPEVVGTTARIQEWDMQQLGILQVRATGGGRFRILERHAAESGLITAQVIPVPEDDNTAGAEFAQCSDFLRKVLARIGNAHFKGEVRFDDPSWVSFRITEILPISQLIKQKMLELTDARMRLEILHRVLQDKQLIA